jgi:frataxin
MLNETDFREKAEEAIAQLEEKLLPVADQHEFEVETAEGILTILFEEPSSTKFIVSPNSPARQIWVSALSTSYKFGWDDAAGFVLDKTHEPFFQVLANLISRHLGKSVQL